MVLELPECMTLIWRWFDLFSTSDAQSVISKHNKRLITFFYFFYFLSTIKKKKNGKKIKNKLEQVAAQHDNDIRFVIQEHLSQI